MAPLTRQQKRLSGIRTRAKAKEQFSSSSSSSVKPPFISKSRRATLRRTTKKQSPPNKDESKVAVDHNNSNVYGSSSSSPPKDVREVKYCRGNCNCFEKRFPSMPEDLAIRYSAKVMESDGFDVIDTSDYPSFGRILPMDYEPGISVEDDTVLTTCAKRALTYYKKKVDKGAKLKFVRVVKANEIGGGIWQYYITFEAVDAGNQIKTIQASVSKNYASRGEIKVELCRLKPTPSPTSAPSS